MKSLFYGCGLLIFQKLTVQSSLAFAPSLKKGFSLSSSSNEAFQALEEKRRILLSQTRNKEPDAREVVQFCMEAGQKYFESEKYIEAIPYFKKCIEILQDKPSQETQALQSKCYFYIGESYLSISKYEEALEKYESSLNILENCQQKCQLLLTKINERLALAYDFQEKPKLALDHFVKTLRLKQQAPDEDQVSIADTLASIAAIYFKLGNSNKFTEYYNKAIKILEKCDKIRNSQVLKVRIKLAPLQYNLCLYDDFAHNIKEAEKKLESIKQHKEANHQEIAENAISISYWKGSLNFALENYEEAFGFYNSALDMSLKHYGKHHPKFQSFYSNIYWLNFMAGKSTVLKI